MPPTPSALAITSRRVAVITFNLPDEPVNKVNRAVKDELLATFDRLERDPAVRAAVLISGKKDTFIAGADIEEFLEIKSAGDAERLSRDGQTMLDRIERGKPVICAIHGACLGGGLEAALACSYRIATDHPKTRARPPRVQLGLSGARGTQRLAAHRGSSRAGHDPYRKNVRAKKAFPMVLVDELVTRLFSAGRRAAGPRRCRRHTPARARKRKAQALLLDGNRSSAPFCCARRARRGIKKSSRHFRRRRGARRVAAGYSGGE